MKHRTDEELDFLLARGKMSGAARERVLTAIERQVTPKPRRFRLLGGGLAAAGLAAAALALLWVRPKGGEFTPKGAAVDAAFTVEIACLESGTGSCHLGDTLVLRVDGKAPSGYLAAYATGESSPEQRIWYFPEANGSWAEVSAERETQVIARGIKLGPEHRAGRYVVHTIVARRPLGRDDALDPKNPEILSRSSRTMELSP